MCGIAGIVPKNKNSKQYQEAINKMVYALRFRGPDGNGTHFFDNCVLGHTRLSIVDLSTGGQPILNMLENLAVTFNGEIYGYQEIKRELNDYVYKTTSDTEVILALYEKYDEEMMPRLPGMFAFAVWDEKNQTLFAARDRFGEKPFYYAWGDGGELIFASEIKAIIASGLIEPRINVNAVAQYLNKLYIDPNISVYENIFVLPPAHSLRLKDGKVEIKRYYSLPMTNDSITLGEATERVRLLADQAVSKQLIADVPVGAFLSGGLDSSTIVALASRYKQGIKTFSFGFGDSINELPYAREVAKMYGTDHLELQAGDYDLGNLLMKMQEIYDEPFGDSSNIPTFLISQAAASHAKVVLSGDAGDELFGGYWSWYRRLVYFTLSQGSPVNFAQTLLIALNNLKPPLKSAAKDLYYAIDGAADSLVYKRLIDAHLKQNVIFSNSELKQLFKNGVSLPTPLLGPLENNLNDAIRYDINHYMPGDILVKTDRAAMTAGIELRAPFLDVDLADFLISLPGRLKVNEREDKLLMRRAFSDLWPESIRKRRKQGFGSPVKHWLGDTKIKSLKQEYLGDARKKIFNYLDFEKTRPIVAKDDYRNWALLNLSLWLETRK